MYLYGFFSLVSKFDKSLLGTIIMPLCLSKHRAIDYAACGWGLYSCKGVYMNKNMLTALVAIMLLSLVSLYLVLPIEHPEMVTNFLFWRPEGARNLDFRQGLDLRGGLQVLLTADMDEDQELPPGAMQTASQIVENRVNALGLTEPIVQVRGQRKINVELPGINDPGEASILSARRHCWNLWNLQPERPSNCPLVRQSARLLDWKELRKRLQLRRIFSKR